MEGQSEKSNPQRNTSFFVRKSWWRLLYYLYFAAVVAGVFVLYSRHNQQRQGPSVAAPPPAPAKQAVATTQTTSTSSPLAVLLDPAKPMIEKGKNLYMTDCVACHGAAGDGNGPAAATLNPKPRDFHSDKGWVNGRLMSGMFKTLTDGITGSAMPPFNSISVGDRLALISYVRTFGVFPKETEQDLNALAKMLPKGVLSSMGTVTQDNN
ncbi:MAG: cytochrome c [Bacteroidetes bacterium]|nr:cytochrome c [Bacteroidota bacterium]